MPAITPVETPRPVAIAVRLLYALVVLAAISLVLRAALHIVKPPTVASNVLGIVLNVLIAYYVGRGKNAARIIVWLVTAVAPITLADSVVFHVAGRDAGRPGWLYPYSLTFELVQLAAFVVVSILLARPESRPYFQRRPAVVTSGSQPG